MPSTNEGYFLWIICILQTTDTTVTPTLTRLWLEEANAPQNQLLITFNYLSRFCTVEGGLTVNYDSSKGNLAGEGGAIESFTKVFIPTELIPEPNPGIQETITVVPYITLDYLAIEYLKTYVKEYLTTSPVTATTALSYNYVEKDAWLQANTQLVKFNASGQLLSESNSIVMTVSTPLFTTPTFTYRVIIGGVEYDNYYTVNGSQITINMVTLLTDHPDFTEATLKMTVVEGALTLYDYVTIYKIQDGSTDVVALLTNEYHTIVAIYDTAGAETRLILDQALCDIKVYQGFNDVTSQYTFTKIDSDSMKSVFYDNRDQLQIIGMPTILTGQVQIVGTHSTLPSVTKTMQLAKSQRGLIVNP
jgi:hypothetical protein